MCVAFHAWVVMCRYLVYLFELVFSQGIYIVVLGITAYCGFDCCVACVACGFCLCCLLFKVGISVGCCCVGYLYLVMFVVTGCVFGLIDLSDWLLSGLLTGERVELV